MELTATQARMVLCSEINARGWSQKDFAKRCGVSASFMNDMVHGRRDLSEKVLKQLGLERVVTYRFRKRGADNG